MRDYVVVKKPLPLNRLQQLDEQLLKIIEKGYHALRMVGEYEFNKLVEMLNPHTLHIMIYITYAQNTF